MVMIASRSFIESRSAMSVPTRNPASAATGSVTGIGKSVPSASRISCEHAAGSQTSPMKRSSGENPPDASSSRSQTTRGDIWSEGRVLA